MVNREEVSKWIEDICGFGYRRPGTEADYEAQEYLIKKFKEFGLDEVWMEPIEFGMWKPHIVEIQLPNGTVIEGEPLQYSTFTDIDGVVGEVVYVDEGTRISDYDIADKIVVVDIRYGVLSINFLRLFAEWIHDPDDSLSDYRQPATWINDMEKIVYEEAKKQGALGIVFIFPFNMRPYILSPEADPYNNQYGRVPGIVLTKNQGERLKKQLNRNVKELRLIQSGEIIKTTTNNILGEIKGRSDLYIIVGSHHDSMWEGGSEEASGTAVVLGAAKHLASQERDSDYSLIF